jgi:hypothetical protein
MDSTWWATSYQQKERKHTTIRKRTSKDRLAVTTVLGTEAAINGLDRHHQNNTEEPEDPDLQMKNATMKMTKKRWGHHALPAGFAPLQSPRDSSYLMINKSTTDRWNHNHGSQIIYKQYKYWEEPKKQQCKVCSYTSPAQQGHG